MTRQLLLIRHAQPERVEDVVGGADPGLTDLGRRQARAMVGWLADEDVVALHSSTARRAIETARPLAEHFGLATHTHEGLLEIDWGSVHYVPFEQLRAERDDRIRAWQSILNEPIEQNEDVRTFVQRAGETVHQILDAQAVGTVAVVCHGGTINAVVAQLLETRTMFVTRTEYAGFSRLIEMDVDLSGTRWVVDSLNEAPFLKGTDMGTSR